LESACEGPQLLQIPFPQPRAFSNAGGLTSYYLELRAPVGYRDRKLAPQVLVMVANDVREARFTGNHNWLLDMTPETNKLGDEALPVGQPFEDGLPGGPKFTLLSVDATKAVIQVELQDKPAQAGRCGQGDCGAATNASAPASPAALGMPGVCRRFTGVAGVDPGGATTPSQPPPSQTPGEESLLGGVASNSWRYLGSAPPHARGQRGQARGRSVFLL